MIETPYAVTPSDRRDPPASRAHARLPGAALVAVVDSCARCGQQPTVSLLAQVVFCGCGRQQVFLGIPQGIRDWNAEQRQHRRERSRQRRAAGWIVLALLLAIVAIVRWRAAGGAA